jgi:hypothetical protein
MRCTWEGNVTVGNNLINTALLEIDEVCVEKNNTETCVDVVGDDKTDNKKILNAYLEAIAITWGGINNSLNSSNSYESCDEYGMCTDTEYLGQTCNGACVEAGAGISYILGQGTGLFNVDDQWSGNYNNLNTTGGMWLNTQLASKLIFKGECAFDPYPYDENNQPIVEDWASQYCEDLGLGGCPDNQECYDSDTYDLCPTGDYACATADNCNALFPCPTIPDFPSIYIQGGNTFRTNFGFLSSDGEPVDINSAFVNSLYDESGGVVEWGSSEVGSELITSYITDDGVEVSGVMSSFVELPAFLGEGFEWSPNFTLEHGRGYLITMNENRRIQFSI